METDLREALLLRLKASKYGELLSEKIKRLELAKKKKRKETGERKESTGSPRNLVRCRADTGLGGRMQ